MKVIKTHLELTGDNEGKADLSVNFSGDTKRINDLISIIDSGIEEVNAEPMVIAKPITADSVRRLFDEINANHVQITIDRKC